MANAERIRTTFERLLQAAALDSQAPRVPVDERVAFPSDLLDAAWRLLEGPADRERAMATCEQLLHDAIDQLDTRRGLAALKLIQKLEAAGVARIYREGEHGMEQLS